MNPDSFYCIDYEEGCHLFKCVKPCYECKGYFKVNKKNNKDADNSAAPVQSC